MFPVLHTYSAVIFHDPLQSLIDTNTHEGGFQLIAFICNVDSLPVGRTYSRRRMLCIYLFDWTICAVINMTFICCFVLHRIHWTARISRWTWVSRRTWTKWISWAQRTTGIFWRTWLYWSSRP